ncbi:oligo-1,6-glucosidase [Peptococcaceae bacterium CEB3]|nr:oligo-1,6-glucosidase [Peptococcaceae bacterium CEB3]
MNDLERTWWKEGVVYQIYPRSFQDSNGDGVGDLKGILSRLDYLQRLGVTILWLSPVYRSPNYDNGYDISDYYAIMPEFGTMADWEDLLAAVHRRGMRLIMDLVVNHTSDEHSWFVASRDRESPYRGYYIWRPGKEDGREPNNWASEFGGSAWEFDEASGEYYLHLFSRKQPDLNWDNRSLRLDIYRMMTWWLDKGIDGFRMDVINLISKDPTLPDAKSESPGSPAWGRKFYRNGPRLQYFLREMHAKVLSKYDIMTVGETPGVDPDKAQALAGEDRHELSMVFQFQLLEIDYEAGDKWKIIPWKLPDFKKIISSWQDRLEGTGWNSLFLNNHDQPRAVSRFGDDGVFRAQAAKMLATLTHTLQGTPYIYQGEELGMTNVKFPEISYYRDVDTLNFYEEALRSGLSPQEALKMIWARGRDNARTPMPWDETENAGFTSGIPWLNLNPNYAEVNVKKSLNQPDSVFYYYQRLIELRKERRLLVYGDYHLLLPEDEQVFAYLRTPKIRGGRCLTGKQLEEVKKVEEELFEATGKEMILVVLNFSAQPAAFVLPEKVAFSTYQLLLCNYPTGQEAPLRLELRPFEARVYTLQACP